MKSAGERGAPTCRRGYTPVPTLDAVHLASAIVLRQVLPDLQLLSTDDPVRANGARMGFEVVPAVEAA